MRRFKRVGPVIQMRLSDAECALLESLVDQLSELLEADAAQPVSTDPFARWQAEMDEGDPLDRDDPVIARLFPDAYPDDPIASAEFRRLTQAKQRGDRRRQAEVVLSALADSDAGKHPVQVRLIELDDWLRILTALRLSLAVRLGIETAADADELEDLDTEDPRFFVHQLYDWLGGLCDTLIALG